MTDTSPEHGRSPAPFQRARAIFEAALAQPPAERASLVERACGGDVALAADVEGMLRASAVPHRWLDGQVLLAADRLESGDVIAGHLQIIGFIGSGGMGEVYRAHDTRLGRDVAVKVLPPTVGTEEHADRLARFRREAQVLASLNHPNIGAIHGLENSDGVHALVLELVDGPTLADRIEAGPIPLDQVVAIARQIAEALEAAHERGIVHRDLKPSNIKLRPDGAVKLLDFGLAKVLATDTANRGDGLASPTLTSPSLVARGVIFGTPAYLSPEQARGEEADRRSDIWAFGAVLYEMLSRRRTFQGENAADTIAAVLREEIEWSALGPSTPDRIRRLIGRCLDRDIRRRLRDIGEARIVLEHPDEATLTGAGPDRATHAIPRPFWRRFIVPAVVVALTGAATGAAVWVAMRPKAPRVLRFSVAATGANALFVDPQSRDIAVTADGARIIYKGGSSGESTQLFVRSLDQLEPSPLTRGGLPKGPFSSPDGQWVGFFERGIDLSLRKVAISGGPPRQIAIFDGPSRGATWGDDDSILVATGALETGLLRVPASGGAPQLVTRPDRERGEADHFWPHYLPGSRAALFTVTSLTGGMEAAQVAVLDVKAGTWKSLIPNASQAQYVSSGHLVYVAGEALWAVAFDLSRLEPTGVAHVVVPQVLMLPTGAAEFDVARDGTLAYVTGGGAASRRRLVWVDRSGRQEEIHAMPIRPYAAARLSPDGTRVAVQIDDGDHDIWVWDLVRETLTRVTTDPGLDQSPLWTADGQRLIFTRGSSIGALFWQAADGSGAAERLTESVGIRRATSVLNDGSAVLYTENANVMTLTLDKSRRVQPVVRTQQPQQQGVISPNGQWLAHAGFDGGSQIFVRPFPNVNDAMAQVSTTGGVQPLWARDGRELFYQSLDGSLMSVPVVPGRTWKPQAPVRVMDPDVLREVSISLRTYDVSPDGRRFLVIKSAPGENTAASPPQVIVVQNWVEAWKGLGRR
ncbi:Serine/threonine-protein kinase PrkC [Luteitalea pratensis]|uniref:Serine/threonine-protein kinase PrkC n=1 Tax=Luteitalea pratensis TaxID=1855912 RepID=A0A143PHP0_LUTPR|nr:protein kinase [Luteitalea pratensis]AMY07936.1 Serine/threonine-protein kinase PrkC [Luteitalea pratensis]